MKYSSFESIARKRTKTPKDRLFPDSSCLDSNEKDYLRIKDEIMLRINLAYTQGHSVLNIVLVVIAVCATLLVFVFGEKEKSIFSHGVLAESLFAFIVALLFSLPIFIALPSSIKYNDNLRAMISLCAFYKAFYEMPRYIKVKKNKKCYIMFWETVHCNAVIPHAKFISIEYFAVSFVMIICSLLVEFYMFNDIIEKAIKSQLFFSLSLSLIISLMTFVFVLFLFIISFVALMKIGKTKTEDIFSVYAKVFLFKYTCIAVDLNVVTNEERKEYLCFQKQIYNEDKKTTNVIKKIKNKKDILSFEMINDLYVDTD